ncbi:hypothetical protein [Salipiger abyssi]|uniref:Uncharacterized protein n=1 Tax=Salipiger abyssi TaxID=1250539 RepID=A0A1P8UQK9_9RHOB|nr:hypothetical protein [Salipiger abyssi]APZ51681.1 hypothetical protein Ga0080574_TMP1347 [Salipiger abyssi]
MGRRGWYMQQQDGALILARRWPARFDLSVETRLPPVARRARLAHQVRQDLWRALQHLRGFSPCVWVSDGPEGTVLRAGGRVEGRAPRAQAEACIAGVLEDAGNRARWVRWSS